MPVWCDRPERSEVVPVVIFCGSFFLVAQKNEPIKIEHTSPLPGADFWLDPKTGKTSGATHEIKKSRPAEDRLGLRSTPLKFFELNLSMSLDSLSGASLRGLRQEEFPHRHNQIVCGGGK
jgi:hypothetical protein